MPRWAERRDGGTAFADRKAAGSTNRPPQDLDDWTDYTKFALGMDSYGGPDGERTQQEIAGQDGKRYVSLTDRRRSMGIDFGPAFTGLSLSLGGVNSIPLGTLQTGQDWKETALKVVQIASTRRVRDIVIGQPLEKDGSEGQISLLVRHFSQLVADSALLVSGPNVTVFLWDERFSTTYAAMRLAVRPRFDSSAFKSWLDGQRGLSFGAKALLDAEAARAILEHWLAKDPATEVLNKEKSERVPPSRKACMAYLKWRNRPLIGASRPKRPEEPAGPGREAWEWSDQNPESEFMSAEEYEEQSEAYEKYMKGMNNFGDRETELKERLAKQRADNARENRIRDLKDDTPLKEAFMAATGNSNDPNQYKGLKIDRDEWKNLRPNRR